MNERQTGILHAFIYFSRPLHVIQQQGDIQIFHYYYYDNITTNSE